MEEYNAVFGQQQLENIHYTISLIESKHKHDKLEQLVKTNISKCVYGVISIIFLVIKIYKNYKNYNIVIFII